MPSRRRCSQKSLGKRHRRLALESLEARLALAAQPIINEILASNDGVLQDVDGDYSDFIEIYNQGDASINLGGWHLTDNAGDLNKWTFPSVTLGAGEYLVVFASSKDRAVAGSQLHTNFALSADGEFLALVQPNGVTIASQFAPTFPPQFEDVSYGVSTAGNTTLLIGPSAPAKAFIPTSGSLGTSWTNPAYVPGAGWQSGTTGVGYSAIPEAPQSITLLEVDFNARSNPATTQSGFSPFIINGVGVQTAPVTRTYGALNVTLSDASGFGYDDRLRGAPTNNGAFTESQLLRDFVFSQDLTGAGGLNVAIDGLTPGEVYTLSVWSYDSGSNGDRVSDWTANGVTVNDYAFVGSATPASNDQYRFGIVAIADALGRITLQGRRDLESNSFGVFLNALRLETGDTLNTGPSSVLRVDFNDRTEGEGGAGDTESGYATMTLDENGAVIGGTKITFSPYNGSVIDDRDRTAPIASGAFTLDQVYDDFIFSSGAAGSGMEILLQGLVPNSSYDLILRSLDGASSGNRQSTWTELSSGSPIIVASPYTYNAGTAPPSNDANAIRATLTTSPQGTLLLRGVQLGANTSVVVNALELTRASFGEVVGTDVEASMQGVNASAYVRVPFAVANLATVDQLLLDMQYDAGFVAYLNGQEVARRNAPTGVGVPPAFNAAATLERSNNEALANESIDLTNWKHLLVAGSGNVLAIHGLNSSAGDEDFLLLPQLRSIQTTGQSFGFFQTPTPGAANGLGVIDFVASVDVSVGHGFYETAFSVQLATATAGANIYYTFDGSIPAANNPAALLYSSPIFVSTTAVLRAAAVKSGYATSPISTETYIFLNDVLTQDPLNNPMGPVYPTVWQGNATGDYEVDPEVVAQWDDNNPANDDFGIREALLSIPTMSIVMDHDDLWDPATGIYPNATSEGDSWRRPGSIEYIDSATGEEFQYNVGVQMHGAASRDNARLKKHSFRLIFSGDFDGPGKLEFPLFDNSNFADINTVVLKAAFTDSFATRTATGRYSPLDSTYTRDVFMMDSQRAMGSLATDATYVHLYINGLYWGLYYPTERVDDAYLASHIGGQEEDWDVVKDFNELFRGNKDVWNDMFALAGLLPGSTSSGADAIYQQLQGKNTDGTLNPSLPVYLDVENLIDYMILHIYGGVEDWPSHNWIAARNRVNPGEGFQFFIWDQEISFDGLYRDRTEANLAFTPAQLYFNLRNSPEFRLQFADRVQKHLFNDGALTDAASRARWQARADQIEAAIIGESARWGDARTGEVVNVPPQTVVPLMTVDIWRDSIAEVHDDYIPQSRTLTISRLQADSLYPTIGAPTFSQFGGVIAGGFALSMSTTSGGATIYYTLNGEDPRLTGGSVNPDATAYAGSVSLGSSVTVKARTRVGTTWSALTEATFVTANASGGIVISEINYHAHAPTAGESAAVPGVVEDDFDFIEILNTHPTSTINLNGMSLANGLSFTFGNTLLAPGQRAIVVENLAAFQARYGAGLNVLGVWSGAAANSGETIELRTALGEIVMAVTYADLNPWSEAADGDGATLELIDPFNTPVERLGKWYSWRASTEFGGSPGVAGVGPTGVVINEVLTHSNAPLTDSIELFNTTNQPINIGGWYLSDAGGTPRKFQIPLGTIIAAGGYVVFKEADFNPTSPAPGQIPFGLKASESDDVFLTIPNGTGGISSIVDSVHFGPAFDNETFGRLPNGSGRLTPLLQPSLGAPNQQPRVGELVLSEIAYNPSAPSAAALALEPSITAQQLQFVEIYNRSSHAISLTNTGIVGGITFNFAAGSQLAAGAVAVVVSFNPALPANAARLAAFRAHYGIGAGVTILGPFTGTLSASGALLELQIPDEPAPETPSLIPKVFGDEVLYDNLSNWPVLVANSGASIQRSAPQAYGSNGANWQSGAATPGTVPFVQLASADFNSDGRVDGADFLAWQRGFGSPNAIREHGNASGDGSVDAQDLSVWKMEFGSSGIAASSVGQALMVAEADYSSMRAASAIATDEAFEADLSSPAVERSQHSSLKFKLLPNFNAAASAATPGGAMPNREAQAMTAQSISQSLALRHLSALRQSSLSPEISKAKLAEALISHADGDHQAEEAGRRWNAEVDSAVETIDEWGF